MIMAIKVENEIVANNGNNDNGDDSNNDSHNDVNVSSDGFPSGSFVQQQVRCIKV